MYKVEKVFNYKGLTCVVTFMDLGFRDGYVAVPKNYKLFNSEHVDGYDFFGEIEFDSACHGGITYTGSGKNNYPIHVDEEVTWFGFDCGHWGDKNDYKTASKYFPQLKPMYDINKQFEDITDGKICDIDYVAEQCKVLADDILDYENNKESTLGLGED